MSAVSGLVATEARLPAAGERIEGILGRIARGGFWSVVAHIAAAGSALVVSIIVARAVGPAPFGKYSYYLWLLRLLPYLLALGIPAAITRLVPDRLGASDQEGAGRLVRAGIRFHVLFAPLAGIVVAWAVSRSQSSSLLAIGLGLGITVTILSLDLEGLLAGTGRFRTLSVIAIAVAGIQVTLAILGVAFQIGWQSYVTLQVVGGVVGLLVALWVCRSWIRGPRDLSSDQRRSLTRFSAVMAFTLAVDAVLWGRPELYFLAQYRPDHELGLYAAALRLAGVAGLLPLVAARALIPEFSRMRGAGNHQALAQAFPRICRILAILGAPLAFGGAAVAGSMMTSVYGDSFSGATGAAALLLAGSFVNAIAAPASAAVLTGPRPRLIAELGAIAVVANLALDFVLIPKYGVMGAAVANVIIQVGSVATGLVYSRYWLGLRYPLLPVARVVLFSLAGAAAAGITAAAINGWLGLLFGIAAGAAVYVALLTVTRTFTPRDSLAVMRGRYAPES